MKQLLLAVVLGSTVQLAANATLTNEDGSPYVRPEADNAGWSQCFGEGWATSVPQPLSREEYDHTYSGEPETVYALVELCKDEFWIEP